uniref:PH domain-containing protein n=1 Tax=Caldilinea aerophila TaxID=133453 RepID=A0A7C1FTI3_9CHLR
MSLPIRLQEDEVVVRIIKRHPFFLIGRLLLIALLLMLGIVIWWWLRSISGGLQLVVDGLMVIGALVALGYAALHWYRYENDLWIVTNQRLIDSTKMTPFDHDVKTASLLNIQDINIQRRGIFQTIFEYGDVICQTASATGATFQFLGVAKPADVLDLIEDQRTLAQQRFNRTSTIKESSL